MSYRSRGLIRRQVLRCITFGNNYLEAHRLASSFLPENPSTGQVSPLPADPVQFPLGWILSNASSAIQYRAITDVVSLPNGKDGYRGLSLGFPPALQLAMAQEADGTWGGSILTVPDGNGGTKVVSAHAVSDVKMRRLSEAEINRAAHKHLDKAGAYAVQAKGDAFVERIRGDYDNVVGLPMRVVKKLLRRAGQALAKPV